MPPRPTSWRTPASTTRALWSSWAAARAGSRPRCSPATCRLSEARRVLGPGGLLCATGLTTGERGLARFVSRAWKGVWARWPALVGGCRPIRLVDALDSSQWVVSYQRTVVAWGIASEILIATRR